MKLLFTLFVFLMVQGCTESDSNILPNGVAVQQALGHLKSQKKFAENSSEFYPGAPDDKTRIQAESIINAAIDKLILSKDNNLSEKEFWSILKIAALQLKAMEQGLFYMEKLMDIYNIESSDNRLNDWRYGFEPN